MALPGRSRELAEVERLLRAAVRHKGGSMAVVGPAGSGKTALVDAAVEQAGRLGVAVHRTAAVPGVPDRLVWAQLLRDTGAPDAAARLLDDPGPLELDRAAQLLGACHSTLLVVDDVDRAGPAAVQFLAVLVSRLAAGAAAVLVTSRTPLGTSEELRLGPLSPDELAEVVPGLPPEAADALWVVSGGLPGAALQVAGTLRDLRPGTDPLLRLALHAPSAAAFMDVEPRLIGLLESAVDRAQDDRTRARLLARLARELLGDAAAQGRRRRLADEALRLARAAGDRGVLAEVLDARLSALWDPDGAGDRLATAAEIIELARTTADRTLERHGLFWRFVALMELGRVVAAESALALYERSAEADGDAAAQVMAAARFAMLATLRGRFEEARALVADVDDRAHRIELPDADRLVMSLRGALDAEQRPESWSTAVAAFRAVGARLPGLIAEATVARILASVGLRGESAVELERVLPRALAASGPRWLGVVSDLAVAAAEVGDARAAAALHAAMLPYRGRLVVWGGANAVNGPVSYFLGVLATSLGEHDKAVGLLREAVTTTEEIGALPGTAHCLVAYADALTARSGPGDAELAAESRARARALAERLGMAVLLHRMGASAGEWSLRRDGPDWLLDAGGEHVRLRDLRGLHYLRTLVAAPGQEVPAVDLVAGGAGVHASSGGPVLDGAARSAYRRRLAVLAEELDAADRAGDVPRARRAAAERNALLGELGRATGLGGRPRQTSPDAERARVNATRALRAAVERVAEAAPRAGAHLSASVRTGLRCRYQPAPGGPSRWRV